MLRERYIQLFDKWKPQQIKEEYWQFIEFMNTQPPVKRFLEIGTAFGTTIPFFAELASDLAITVDIRPLQYERLTDPKVKYIVGDSANPAIVEQIKQHLNGELFDLIFVDGAHEYPAVKRDYHIYKNFVRKGGILAFHDVVILPEVKKFWDEIVPTLENYRVFYLTDGTGNGIGTITI
jgi:cephalosporin hydroxylase